MLRVFLKKAIIKFLHRKITYEVYADVKICHPSWEVEYHSHFEIPQTPLKDFTVILCILKLSPLCSFMVLSHMYGSSPKILLGVFYIYLSFNSIWVVFRFL